jgi:LAO/AO transport system kinase
MVDCLVLVLVPGGGDEVQGMKRGIVELSDLVVINKADGADLARAEDARQQLLGAFSLLGHAGGAAGPPVLVTSALEGRGVFELWLGIVEHGARAARDGRLERRRARGRVAELERGLAARLAERFLAEPGARDRVARITEAVRQGELAPRRALEEILES